MAVTRLPWSSPSAQIFWKCHPRPPYNRAPLKSTGAQLEDVLASLRDPRLRYADIPWTATHEQHVRVRNGEVETLSSTIDRAIGVRVLVGDGWGLAANSDTSDESSRRTARRAVEVAAARNSASTQRVLLSDVEPPVAT